MSIVIFLFFVVTFLMAVNGKFNDGDNLKALLLSLFVLGLYALGFIFAIGGTIYIMYHIAMIVYNCFHAFFSFFM